MFELRCTVRSCPNLLTPTQRGLVCDAGHHFDQAKEGYWNLLQPQDRRSKNPGDSDSAVLARRRWLQRGHAKGLIETLKPLTLSTSSLSTSSLSTSSLSASSLSTSSLNISTLMPTSADREVPARVLDLGCGEGSFGPALFADHAAGYCGIELSKRAIKLAAKGWPDATWVLANADRFLPAKDKSVDCVISLFGRRPLSEIVRVLAPDGICIVAVPGQDDLIELREQVQQSGHRRSRWEMIIDEMKEAGLQCDQHVQWKQPVELEQDAIADALAMTYRAVRHSQQSRVASLTTMMVTLAADILLLRHAKT